MSAVVGIDLSLASTGLAIVDTQAGTITVDRIQSKPTGATLPDRYRRLERIARQVGQTTDIADLVIIEGPSFGQSRQGGEHDRAGLWWMVAGYVLCSPVPPVVEVPPASLKKYATGKGNAKKDAVLAAVVRRYPDVDVTGNDQADALVLAAMGARALGEPVEPSLPAVNLTAMAKIAWPEPAEAVNR